MLKLGLAHNEGTRKMLFVGNSQGWRNPELNLFKESKRQTGILYKERGEIRRTSGNTGLLD